VTTRDPFTPGPTLFLGGVGGSVFSQWGKYETERSRSPTPQRESLRGLLSDCLRRATSGRRASGMRGDCTIPGVEANTRDLILTVLFTADLK